MVIEPSVEKTLEIEKNKQKSLYKMLEKE